MTVTPRILVERFYYEVWNKADEAVAREILHGDFRFRASLGPERRGPDGFIDYLRAIHRALADYTCIIDDLVCTEARAAARMTFKGTHRGRFFEIPPTGKEIKWAGAAFFRTKERVEELRSSSRHVLRLRSGRGEMWSVAGTSSHNAISMSLISFVAVLPVLYSVYQMPNHHTRRLIRLGSA